MCDCIICASDTSPRDIFKLQLYLKHKNSESWIFWLCSLTASIHRRGGGLNGFYVGHYANMETTKL